VTRYELFKLLHVVGAIGWLGGGIGLFVLTRRLLAASDHAGLLALGRQSQSLGTWLFMPAALLTVGFGIALVATERAFRFTDLWILIGFGGIVLSGVVQMSIGERANRRFLTLAEEHGVDHPDVATAARRLSLGSGLDIAILLVVLWAMVAKPTL
jgi:uncharacterized membrane protein